MKQYPSIPNLSKAPHKPCHAFVKYDGSNLRFEWTKKRGWYKFGTRTQMLPESHPAVELFKQKYNEDLARIFQSEKMFRGIKNFVVFCEFFGAESFAGQHKLDDPKTIILIDVNPVKKDLLAPKAFLDIFGHLEVAEMVYQGNLNQELINAVRSEDFTFVDFRSRYPIRAESPEGIVCKGPDWMCKIKTQRYFDTLRQHFPTDWAQYW